MNWAEQEFQEFPQEQLLPLCRTGAEGVRSDHSAQEVADQSGAAQPGESAYKP